MEILNKTYINSLVERSKQSLNSIFDFSNNTLSKFDIINSYLIDNILNTSNTNILITNPIKDKVNNYLLPTILITSLRCLNRNCNENATFEVADIIISKQDGRISAIKEIKETQIRILPLGTTKRIDIDNITNHVLISPKLNEEIIEIGSRSTIDQRGKGYLNFQNRIFDEYKEYKSILEFFNFENIHIPYTNNNKVIVIGFKNEIIPIIPKCIPYQYMNKKGKTNPDTTFDPLLIVVNDFSTVKEFFIDKNIPIETIIFVGDNKYQQSISAISKNYRQQKYNHCIFIGTQDIETGENFEILKWNWTLPEVKFLDQKQYKNLNQLIINHFELSEATLKFTNFIDETEKHFESLINLKRLLKFIRKIYPITAIGNENRIRERANEIYTNFEKEAEQIFQDEYYSIDADYETDLKQIKVLFKNIIDLIKTANAKNEWFKDAAKVDYIVVPKSIKNHCEKEIENCLKNKSKGVKVNSFDNVNELLSKQKERKEGDYFGLKETKILTVSEYLKKEIDEKKYLFLSLFSNGIYTDVLLKKILAKNLNTKILCYKEEAKVMQAYLLVFQREDEAELHSSDREKLCGLQYPKTQNIDFENIDEWIEYLIGMDEQRNTRGDEQMYEIQFEEVNKLTKERESRKVLVDGYEDELYKDINQLKKGDKVRIYHNPDKETLHDIIKMTDEKSLFTRVDSFSSLWKGALRTCLSNKNIDQLFEELTENGLSVSKTTLKLWLKDDCKTKFPEGRRDIVAIIKTVNNTELNNNIGTIISLKKEYLGRLNKDGRIFSDEIDQYILTNEKGKMLSWLSDNHIKQIIANGAPLLTIKSIKIIEEENE